MKEQSVSAGEQATQSRYNLMQLAATMEDVVSFGAGDPDLPTPPHIVREAVRLLAERPCSVPVRGLPELRRALAEHYRAGKGVVLDPEREILITNGAQEALFLTVLALINPGEGVLVPDPRYSSYDQAIEAAGGRMVELPTGRDRCFGLEAQVLEQYAASGKALVLVNPGNPTGALISAEEVERIAAAARRAGLIVVSDEVYESLVFDNAPYRSIMQCRGMRDRTVTISSFSKTYAMTGFRVGFLLGPGAFISAVSRMKQITSGPCPLLSQYAALAALTGPQQPAREILEIFTRRREVMRAGLDSLEIPYGHPGGTFFIWADISRFGMQSEEFCRCLLTDQRVLLFPGTAFGRKWQGYVRISILQQVERIREGLERIERFVRSLHPEHGGG